ncbi:2-polyprenyl-6-methoxyphenol hydroxylase-like FAD-dependent oxidoreductase [Luteibacter rhizovicinus]|uniref:Flavin-dependent monooxygenase n=1 Tax=Luteibacter rhizovicinus TaxID=242606 RepID=A0A4R3YIN1_9GAMM|nr:NAD(P)/FAD-dependent oxidoreductase [Luteibacter rhizovicinus]TCV91178.1 2-polyprenyl-6-methoxyphenol hydroxylase-like FAD-dependent oxidoreductase [Luteibacter rhizovicinus]
MAQSLRIGIVGAGPAGLTLARVLQERGIRASVFEAELSTSHRTQGGSLDMHAESGQRALQIAGLYGAFGDIARYEDQGSRVYDRSGALLFDEQEDGDRPEVDRGILRDLLLASLAPDTVQWGMRVSSVQCVDDGFELTFVEGQTARFDVVVGTDGAWSRTRAQLSPILPFYTGVLFVELGIDDVDRQHPDIANLVGRGKIFALGDEKGLIAQRNANGHVRVYAALKVPEDWGRESQSAADESKSLRDQLLAEFESWDASLLSLIGPAATHLAFRPLWSLPPGHRWPHQKGITVIGDAAHLMTPFGGEGANLAMLDAAELGLALASGDDWPRAVEQFEETMWTRAEGAARGALEGLNEAMSIDGRERVLAHMHSHEA